jgi:hypothetical protein
MEDMERYGDYNEVDESPSKNPVTMLLKGVLTAVCFMVIGFLLFRIILFNYYPAEIKQLYFNDALTAYYQSVGGNMEVLTQDLRAPYDDEDDCNFFCDNLLVITDADQLQISLRYNEAINAIFLEKYGVDISKLGFDAFTFTLVRDSLTDDKKATVLLAENPEIITDSLMMYRYAKLVFDGVDFGLDEGENKAEWIRLEIELNGAKEKTVFMIPVYENNSEYSSFDEYKISAKERP